MASLSTRFINADRRIGHLCEAEEIARMAGGRKVTEQSK
jgi:hypothetical protein